MAGGAVNRSPLCVTWTGEVQHPSGVFRAFGMSHGHSVPVVAVWVVQLLSRLKWLCHPGG